MHLHRNTRSLARQGALMSALGWGSAALAWLGVTFDMYPGGLRYSPLFFYVLGPLIGVVGMWQLPALMRPFRLTVDSGGLVVQTGRHTHHLEWSEIDSIEVAPEPTLKDHEQWTQASLVLWPAAHRRLAGLQQHHLDGRDGFVLLAFNDFKEPPGRVIKVLQRYGGEKINVSGYLDYVESRRQFARYLRRLEAEIEARKANSDKSTT